ncbi:fructan hydrolase FruA [Streptococcus ratti FA-1 = DSM 20564]|uniref:Fructan hydrolase n=1 Tax=Streptococcus ratti FA-1 = DSM 20564 TaxID=699248 RepID=A0ABN0GSF1_STRRT|nr:fructan hydrolase [Streptococcus ratti FA-1 = DSM 20564]EMP69519.1 fructan hydrolase FruA [Streptococcus ratti FA-1 = DSM 20564]VEI59232.1 fructan hydrolase [Streptococcus mutans]
MILQLASTSSFKEESLPFTIVSLTDNHGKQQNYVRFTAEHFSEYSLVYQADNQMNPQNEKEENDISYSPNSKQELKNMSISQKPNQNVSDVKTFEK